MFKHHHTTTTNNGNTPSTTEHVTYQTVVTSTTTGASGAGGYSSHSHPHEPLPHGGPVPVIAPHVYTPPSDLTKELVQAGGEFVGTFFFLFIAYSAIQASVKHQEHFVLSISLAVGLGLTCGIWFAYRISGGALNPAVVFALYLLQKITQRKAALYVAAQVLAATVAAFVVSAVVPGSWGGHFKGANQVFAGTSLLQAFFLEALLTAGLVLLVLFIAVEKSKATYLAPLIIGLFVAIAHFASIPYTNTSLNPARTFGSALIAGNWNAHWLFWIAPLSGAALAAGVYKVFKHYHYELLNLGQEDDHAPGAIALP
ncbi:aquaporin-like protein [Zopfochytrium polystomum]|nr:aquaporin-like protein [Zopfochytrium polystomum]